MNTFLRNSRIFTLVVFIANMFLASGVFGQATLTSNLPDYEPGTTAILTGSGFLPGEQVKMLVLHANNHPVDYTGSEHESWFVTADTIGNFVTTWRVSDSHCVGKLLRASAIGQSSGENVWHEFTDPTITSKVITGNWNDPNTWVGGIVPIATDDVVIAVEAIVTVTDNRTAKSITIAGGSKDTQLKINTGITLNVSGDVTINGPGSNNKTNEIIVGSGIMNVAGNLIVNGGGSNNRIGQITISTGTVDVNGNVTTNNASLTSKIVFSGSGFLNIGGNFSHDGVFTKSTSTVTFDGTTQLIGGGVALDFNILTIANGSTTTGTTAPTASTFNINGGGKYIQTTGAVVPGTTKNFASTSTYEWQTGGGTTFPSVSGITFGNLTINTTSGNNTAGGNLTMVNGNLYIQNTIGGSYRIASTTSPTVNISGNLQVDAGILNFSSSTGNPIVNVTGNVTINGGTLQPAITGSVVTNLNIGGNWLNNGTFTTGSGSTVTMNGGSPQTMSGSTFNNLTINNSSGVTLLTDETVNGTLTLTSGLVNTGANTMIIGSSGSISGASSASYINGKLARLYSGTGSKTFPIGKGGAYRPLTLNYAALTGTSTVTAEQIESTIPGTIPTGYTAQSGRYWEISQTGGNGFTYNITLDGTPFTPGADDPFILKGDGVANTAFAATFSSPNFTATGLTSFSNFAAASAAKDCPVSTAVTPSADQTVCVGGATNLLTATITTSGGTGNPTLQYQWYYNTTNSNTVAGATLISGATAQTYTPLSTASEVGTRYYFVVGYATNNGCGQTNADQALASNTVKVTVVATPSTAAAGPNQTICPGSSATLAANTPENGTGAWSVVSGSSTNLSQFSSTTNPAATFTPDGGNGVYTLRWTISNAPCTASTDDVVITMEDVTNPAITCTTDKAVGTDAGECTYTHSGTAWNATATDNCAVTSITYVLSGATTGTGSSLNGVVFNKGTTTVTWTALDAAGNDDVCSFDVVVSDDDAPVISGCKPNSSRFVDPYLTAYTIQNTEFDVSASDNCTLQSLTYILSNATDVAANAANTSLANVVLNWGTTHVKWIAVDNVGNTSICEFNITLNKRPTVLTYTGDFTEQYSDQQSLKAVLTDETTGDLLVGKTVSFILGTQSAADGPGNGTDDDGLAETTVIITQAPGYKDLSGSFAGDDTYLPSSFSYPTTSTPKFEVICEDAILDYIGNELVATISSTNKTANIDLRVAIQDIDDLYRGDITNATVKFVFGIQGSTGTDVLPYTAISTLIDPYTGVISKAVTVTLSGTSTSEIYELKVYVNNYYCASVLTVPITVYVPVGDFITGGGHIKPTSSAGKLPSDNASKTNFGFNVKYNKKGTSLQGKLNFIWRSGGRIYQAKSNATDALGVDITNASAKTATFTSKCTVSDITNPDFPITTGPNLGGNRIMHVTMTDRGEPGINNDDIGFTLWDGNILVYSSKWSGTSTSKMLLSGGNLVVHSGFNVGSSSTTARINTTTAAPEVDVPPTTSSFNVKLESPDTKDPITLKVMVYPNPSINQFTVAVEGSSTENVQVMVFDVLGRLLKTIEKKDGEAIQFGEDLPTGSYITKISQGAESKTVQLIKK